jgi:ATP-binding protein involved in chromosome partitioning
MTLPDGQTVDIFGKGGAERAAQALKVPFLGALPLYPELRANSDAGDPGRNFSGNSALAQALERIVQNLVGQVTVRNSKGVGPQLNVM